MKLLLEHTIYLTGSVQAMRYSIQEVYATKATKPISPDMLRIVYVRAGRCRWIISGKTYEVGPGDIVLLNNTEKRYQTGIEENNPVLQEVLRFMPVAFPECSDALPVFFDRKPEYSNVLTGDFPGRDRIIQYIDTVREEAKRADKNRDTAMMALMQLILIYVSRTYQQLGMTVGKISGVFINSGNYQLICDSVNYIKENLGEPLCVELLAHRVGISRSYYSRMFNALMGMSVPQYIRLRRVIRVNEYVKAGQSVINAVYASGFGSLSAYYKTLKDTGL